MHSTHNANDHDYYDYLYIYAYFDGNSIDITQRKEAGVFTFSMGVYCDNYYSFYFIKSTTWDGEFFDSITIDAKSYKNVYLLKEYNEESVIYLNSQNGLIKIFNNNGAEIYFSKI